MASHFLLFNFLKSSACSGEIILKSCYFRRIILLKSHCKEGAMMLLRKMESLIEDYLQSGSKKILLIDGVCNVGKNLQHRVQKVRRERPSQITLLCSSRTVWRIAKQCSFKPGDNALIYQRDTAAGISYQCSKTTKGSGLYCSPLSFSRPISMTQNNCGQGGSTMLSHKNTKNANFLFIVDMQ